MRQRVALLLSLTLLGAKESIAQVLRVTDLNTRQIAALDRTRTVVVLEGGMLEEHGPYLPAFTDGFLSERLASDVAAGIVARMPGWSVLRFPPISVGSSGSNEIGRRFVFPGTYAVRPSTLRAIYMDLATELGEQGFRWVILVHIHGSPLQLAALDDACDWFHDTYGGTMVNLWGLLPVLAGWGGAMTGLPADQRRDDGVSLHAGLDETSLMLYLHRDLVTSDYGDAPSVSAATVESAFVMARRPGWTGYLGAPRHGSAELGRRIWTSFSDSALSVTLRILNGADPAQFQRYGVLLTRSPSHREWIAEARRHDETEGARQRAWLERRQQP